jgi:hypothetical protein
MDIWILYENYKQSCEAQGIEPMPFAQYKEDWELDNLDDMRQEQNER